MLCAMRFPHTISAMTVTAFPAPQQEGASAIVARNLRILMAERGVSQGQLASVLGIAQPNVSKRLKGRTPWTTDDLDKLAEAFMLDHKHLLDREFAHLPASQRVSSWYQFGFRTDRAPRRHRWLSPAPALLAS
jgi:transcriptional regulator with XRE-family HTH domain